MMIGKNLAVLAVFIATYTLFAVEAAAKMTGSPITVEISNEAENIVVTWSPSDNDGTWTEYENGDFEWVLDTPVEISIGADTLGTLNSARLYTIADPVINLDFTVSSSSSGSNFTITSSVLNFSSIPNAEANATAEVTVTDTGTNGVLINKTTGGKLYNASYNGSTSFKDLLGDAMVPVSGTSTVIQEDYPLPAGTFEPLTGAVSSMQAKFAFWLGGDDQAVATSTFTVNPVPEPAGATVALIGLLGLALARRRVR